MGGPVPLGYTVREKKLIACPIEAEQVRGIFARYLDLGCLNALAADLRERGVLTKVSPRRDGTSRGGIPFSKGPLAYLLRNRTYIGEVIHKGQHYRGEHAPIVSPELFEAVQAALSAKAQADGAGRANRGSLLRGLLYDDRGNRMTPSSAKKGALRYRYYVSRALEEGRRGEAGSVARVPAPEIEQAVLSAISRGEAGEVTGADAVSLAERVSRVVVQPGSLAIHLLAEQEESGDKPILVPWSAQAGRRRREVIPTGDKSETVSAMRSETRARLLEGIAKARLWLDDLLSGRVQDTAEIARQEGCSERSVRMTLNLAFLAPDLVQAALAGRLPEGQGISVLTQAPLSWTEQRDFQLSDQAGL